MNRHATHGGEVIWLGDRGVLPAEQTTAPPRQAFSDLRAQDDIDLEALSDRRIRELRRLWGEPSKRRLHDPRVPTLLTLVFLALAVLLASAL